MQDKAQAIAMRIMEADGPDIRDETRDLCVVMAELANHVAKLERQVRYLTSAAGDVRDK